MTRQNKVAGRGRTSSIAGSTVAIVGSLLLVSNVSARNVWAAGVTVSPQTTHDETLPRPLSDADAARYRTIFELQAKSQWSAADPLIAALSDHVLLGSVEAQRYLSPSFQAKYSELCQWLRVYGDAPEAARIYALALKRQTRGASPPARPITGDGHKEIERTPDPIINARAIGVGDEAASAYRAPSATWLTGLAAWRANKIDRAKHAFETAARTDEGSPWAVSAAAFWAARAELRSDHPELFNYWLGIAAQNPRTFYGLLARRTLGVDSYIDFDLPGFTMLDGQILNGIAAGHRALALVQIGDNVRAEAELRALAQDAPANLLESILALADRGGMVSLAVSLTPRVVASSDDDRNRVEYPVPRWRPRGGFQVDRALLYGLMRQESKFRPVARNASGASGLMQLMPSTARTMAAHTGLRGGLSDPSTNLALAQQYVIELLSDSRVNGNLLYFAVAYNRGPGALPPLQEEARNGDDPLMFVESIARRETRFFIHQVLTNYWIYRLRLRQPTPDLDALAAGEWPIYTGLDDGAEVPVRHAEN
jgi:soluble lytic murein transglycosylase